MITEKRKDTVNGYKSFFGNSADGLFRSSIEGRFIMVNKAMADLWGCSSPEKMIETITDIRNQCYMYPEDRDKVIHVLMKHGCVRNYDFMAKRQDGSTFWCQQTTIAVKDESGRIKYFEGSNRDTTDKREMLNELKESQENFKNLSMQYQFILDSIPDMVWTKDTHNNFTFVNKTMRATLKKEADEIIGKSMFDITDEMDGSVLESDEIAKTLETCHFIESFKVNGGEVWLDVTKAPIIKDNILVGTIGTARDITHKVENERFLESYIDKEIAEWSKEQAISNARIEISLNKIQNNIQRLKEI